MGWKKLGLGSRELNPLVLAPAGIQVLVGPLIPPVKDAGLVPTIPGALGGSGQTGGRPDPEADKQEETLAKTRRLSGTRAWAGGVHGMEKALAGHSGVRAGRRCQLGAREEGTRRP